MANYRIAKSLAKMREQFNALYPLRSKSIDGWIGDAAHASRTSDHNPWVKDGKMGVVTALDITHDPANGVDTHKIADHLRLTRDTRIKYVISNGRIFSNSKSPYQWRRYTGSNPHRTHMHVSVHSTKNHYDNENEWALNPGNRPGPGDPDSPKTRPVLKRGARSPFVNIVQNILDIKVDGIFGQQTESAVKKFQTENKLSADGIVGQLTWGALDKIEQRDDGEDAEDVFED